MMIITYAKYVKSEVYRYCLSISPVQSGPSSNFLRVTEIAPTSIVTVGLTFSIVPWFAQMSGSNALFVLGYWTSLCDSDKSESDYAMLGFDGTSTFPAVERLVAFSIGRGVPIFETTTPSFKISDPVCNSSDPICNFSGPICKFSRPGCDLLTPPFKFLTSADESNAHHVAKAPPVPAADVRADAIDSHADTIDARIDAYAKKKTMNIIVIPPEVVTLEASSSAYV
jgi:hypothetical protein